MMAIMLLKITKFNMTNIELICIAANMAGNMIGGLVQKGCYFEALTQPLQYMEKKLIHPKDTFRI